MPKKAFSNLLLTSGLLLGLPLLFQGILYAFRSKYEQRIPASINSCLITSYLLSHNSNICHKNPCIYFHGTMNRPVSRAVRTECVAIDQDRQLPTGPFQSQSLRYSIGEWSLLALHYSLVVA
jgi:hypothetical protein